MPKRLALLHTVSSLVTVFKELSDELIAGTDIFNIVDESLLQNCIREKRLSPITARRLVNHVISAEEAGADIVMVTCSSMGPAVEMARSLVNIPVLRVDEPMAEQAVRTGRRIGVAATLNTTLEPTASLIRARGAANGKKIEVTAKLCEGAFEAVVAGDASKHDAIVSAALQELVGKVDVVVLAQASMARVVATLPESESRVPILSSPRLAMENLAEVLRTQ